MPSSHVPSRPEKSARRRVRRRPAKLVHPLPTELTERLEGHLATFAQHNARGSAGRLDRRRSGGLHRSDGHRSRSPGWRKGQAQLRSVRLSPWQRGRLGDPGRPPSPRFDDQEFAAPMARLSCLSRRTRLPAPPIFWPRAFSPACSPVSRPETMGPVSNRSGGHRGASRLHEPRRGQPPLCHGHRGAAIRAPGPPSGRPPLTLC